MLKAAISEWASREGCPLEKEEVEAIDAASPTRGIGVLAVALAVVEGTTQKIYQWDNDQVKPTLSTPFTRLMFILPGSSPY